jgi:nitroreductase
MNAQPWHFIFVQDRETLRKIAEVNTHGPFVAQAPLAVVVAYDSDSRFGVSDVSRAVQSMILTAWSEGVGSTWSGWSWLQAINPIVGLPAGKTVLAIVPFGYPVRARKGTRKSRKPFDEVISGEKFGRPLR